MIRLHVHEALAAGASVSPSPDQSRYLIAVMRLAIGSEVLLFNGRDGEWRAIGHGQFNAMQQLNLAGRGHEGCSER